MADSWDVGGFLANLTVLGAKMEAASAQAAEDVAEYVLAQAMQEVPHEDGDLQASGKVSTDPANQRAAVSFDTPYAVRQHEEMSWKHDEGRKAKYLEDPMNAAAKGPAQAIYKKHLGQHFGGS